MEKIRIIYDMCTPTKERRVTTAEDIKNDIRLEEVNSKEELLDLLLELDDLDLEDLESTNLDDQIKEVLDYLSDPGDGSPDILYLMLDGEDFVLGHDALYDLDLETCSLEDVIQALIKAGGFNAIGYDDVLEYLKDNRRDDNILDEDDLAYMADDLLDAIQEEEGWDGPYENIDEVDIGGLLEAAGGKLYRLGQIWFGFNEDDEEDDHDE